MRMDDYAWLIVTCQDEEIGKAFISRMPYYPVREEWGKYQGKDVYKLYFKEDPEDLERLANAAERAYRRFFPIPEGTPMPILNLTSYISDFC